MILKRLRLLGFKSFVDASEFVVEPGLTGIVGPNGCGKSNLVEGMRWVMGESSHKAMRAAEMDDVIFAGSSGRPARNVAEIVLGLDNSGHTAPAPWTADDTIEIARRIERGKGSSYRINGREVRARDVQMLFADASTGARSPALVRQGQIGEIINARPEARRRVLEEAAGIAGLHARRHEAELRLRTAGQNLLRVEDAIGRMASQIEGLKRQARHAARYRNLSAEIRRLEAVVLERAYAAAKAEAEAAGRVLAEAERQVAARLVEQAEAARAEGVASHALPPLREAAAAAAAALERIRHASRDLDREGEQARARLEEIDRQLAVLASDAERETALAQDATANVARLTAENAALGDEDAVRAAEAAAEGGSHEAETVLGEAEAAFTETATRLAERRAARDALLRAVREAGERCSRLDAEAKKINDSIAVLEAGIERDPLTQVIREAEEADARLAKAETALRHAESALQKAREAETIKALPAKDADAEVRRYEVEAETIAKLLRTDASGGAEPVLDALAVERGYEIALGAALSDDLQAPLDSSAPVHWAILSASGDDPALPEGAEPLDRHVSAPEALSRRLAQIGIVTRDDGRKLQEVLAVGQRLVSREGDLWRWDGFTSAAEAPTTAARRLAEKNRLDEVGKHLAEATRRAGRHREELKKAQEMLAGAMASEQSARADAKAARQTVDALRTRRATAERGAAERDARRSNLLATRERVQAESAEAVARLAAIEESLGQASDNHALEDELQSRRTALERVRSLAAEHRAAREAVIREREHRARRRQGIIQETSAWSARRIEAEARLSNLTDRRERAQAERLDLIKLPEILATRRIALVNALDAADGESCITADRLNAAEALRVETDRAARHALAALSEAREHLARTETRKESAQERAVEAEARLRDTLGRGPTGVPESEATIEQLSDELDRLKQDRERLGAVNLMAEEELVEVQSHHTAIDAERNDLTEAIRQLRQAIQTLNREGRDRLNAAFVQVNAHFQQLFATLFGGGEAHLVLVESDDPLDAGLEIMARPPGKKPQTLSLLSGGEQALTAMAMIFAIFLTNPAPVCVLDEVDAPLDDANVERFCDLLEAMRRQTDTRFLVVTHNPVTMSRMDRLFGVTMAERGVSQLVSVDLETAERLRDVV